MTDIVERLRSNAPADHGLASGDLMREAADEIERLTEEVNALRLVATAHDAEVERLRARNADLEEQILHALGERKTPRAALEPKP